MKVHHYADHINNVYGSTKVCLISFLFET